MQKKDFPYFSELLKTIGIFLSKAKVEKNQQEALDAAKKALDTITQVLYAQEREGEMHAILAPCISVRRISGQ